MLENMNPHTRPEFLRQTLMSSVPYNLIDCKIGAFWVLSMKKSRCDPNLVRNLDENARDSFRTTPPSLMCTLYTFNRYVSI